MSCATANGCVAAKTQRPARNCHRHNIQQLRPRFQSCGDSAILPVQTWAKCELVHTGPQSYVVSYLCWGRHGARLHSNVFSVVDSPAACIAAVTSTLN